MRLFGAHTDGGKPDGGRADADKWVCFHGVAGIARNGKLFKTFGKKGGVFLVDGFLKGRDVVFDEVERMRL